MNLIEKNEYKFFGLSEIDLVMIASICVMVWNTAHKPLMAIIMIPILLASLVKKIRYRPIFWYLIAASWLPFFILSPVATEDHVFLGIFWIIAIGVSLTNTDELVNLLKHHARYLIGFTFAAASLWKATSNSFLNGDVFRQVLFFDDRFREFHANILAGLTNQQLEENKSTKLDLVANASDSFHSLPLISDDRLTKVVLFMAIFGLIIEILIAVSFLAPENSKISKIRHPALLIFSWSIYPFVPVLGFALLLCILGYLLCKPESRYKLIYIFSAASFSTALIFAA